VPSCGRERVIVRIARALEEIVDLVLRRILAEYLDVNQIS
jgi:hypothetical protein